MCVCSVWGGQCESKTRLSSSFVALLGIFNNGFQFQELSLGPLTWSFFVIFEFCHTF